MAGAGVTLFLCSWIRCVVTHIQGMPQRHLQVKLRTAGHFSGDKRWQRDTVGCRAQLPVCMHSGIDTIERRNWKLHFRKPCGRCVHTAM